MHPINNTNRFKSFIFRSSLGKIFFGFILLYFLVSVIYILIYILFVDIKDIKELVEYSLYTSFGFNADIDIKNNHIFSAITFSHQIIALLLSTIFTAAIVLKFFYLPTFFVFKKRCNYIEENNELIISLYNSTNIFVTNCNIRVYGREESIDINGTKSLININANQPLFDKTYPFMEQYLVTRLRIKMSKGDELWELFKDRKNKRLDLIILVEANASNLDSSIYEIYKYRIDFENLKESVDFYYPNSIDLDYDDFSKSRGWEKFDV